MRRHLILALLLVALFLFSLIACDRSGTEVDVGGGGVVMNPGSSVTTSTTDSSSRPDAPEEGGGVNLPYLPA